MQNLEKCSKTILFYLLMSESFGGVQITRTFIEYRGTLYDARFTEVQNLEKCSNGILFSFTNE